GGAVDDRDRHGDRGESAELRPEQHAPGSERPGLVRADEVGDAPGEARAEREQEPCHSTGLVAAVASSWFAWESTAASAGPAARAAWGAGTQWGGAARGPAGRPPARAPVPPTP